MYYVLSRVGETNASGPVSLTLPQLDFQIVHITSGDPLYGYGSWDLFSGPFDTWDEAEVSIPDDAS